MKIACFYGPLCLAFRQGFDFSNLWIDPRGLTGSELGFVRIAQELKKLGHTVELFTVAEQTEFDGMRVRPWSESDADEYDAAIAINEPDLLRPVRAKVRVCEAFLNDWSFAKPDFEQHVDLFVSPSAAHLNMALNEPSWRDVNVTPQTPRGTFTYTPDPSKWTVLGLGCDPELYTNAPSMKVPGRVLFCSSPDRGLHWLLQEWPQIKRACPEARLRITYRLQPWLRQFDEVDYFPAIEPLRQRSLFIEECLRRMSGPEWGIEVVGSVSREQIVREMCEATVVAYPCDPVNQFTEGFSCSTLEACAAQACPTITDVDALGEVYGGHVPMTKRGDWTGWRENVIRALTDAAWRDSWNDKAEAFAKQHTWAGHAKRLEAAILERLPKWEPVGLVGT